MLPLTLLSRSTIRIPRAVVVPRSCPGPAVPDCGETGVRDAGGRPLSPHGRPGSDTHRRPLPGGRARHPRPGRLRGVQAWLDWLITAAGALAGAPDAPGHLPHALAPERGRIAQRGRHPGHLAGRPPAAPPGSSAGRHRAGRAARRHRHVAHPRRPRWRTDLRTAPAGGIRARPRRRPWRARRLRGRDLPVGGHRQHPGVRGHRPGRDLAAAGRARPIADRFRAADRRRQLDRPGLPGPDPPESAGGPARPDPAGRCPRGC